MIAYIMQEWKPGVNPSVYAHLVERYLFNFRLSPDALSNHIPAAWLRPQVFNGHGVVSFCILKLHNLTLWPLPSVMGFDTISCAYRCGVIDGSRMFPEPSVYVVSRNTNAPIISRFAPILFSGAMHMIQTDIMHGAEGIDISAMYPSGKRLFAARVRPSRTPEKLDSQLFESLGSLVNFIKNGASSYTPSTQEGSFSRVDLKEETTYEAVDAKVAYSLLDRQWAEAGLVFDSAVRARTGGQYRWTYRGRTSGPTLKELQAAANAS